MKLDRAPGVLGIYITKIRRWYHDAKVKENEYPKAPIVWKKLTVIRRLAYAKGDIPSSLMDDLLFLSKNFEECLYWEQCPK